MINNKSKILILFTANFPFGLYETFLEAELKYLKKNFDKIVIVSQDYKSDLSSNRIKNSEIDIIRLNPSKKWISLFYFLFAIFNKNILKEFLFSLKYQKNIYVVLKILLKTLSRALYLKNQIKIILKKYSSNREVYLYSYWMDDIAISIALIKSKNKSINKIVRAHGWDIYFDRSEYNFLPFRKLLLNDINSIFTVSTNGENYLNSLTTKRSVKIATSRIGVFSNYTFEDLEFKRNKLKLISCSYIIPLKRIELIIDSLRLIENIDIHWMHIGKGIQSFEYQSNIEFLISDFKKDNIKISFIGDILNSEVINIYKTQNFDLFINLSKYEGIPVSIMEAFSFGIPAIATDVGGISEIVDNFNGYLLGSNPSPKEVANKILEFNSLNFKDRNNKRLNAYKTWNQNYNANTNYQQFVDQVLSL